MTLSRQLTVLIISYPNHSLQDARQTMEFDVMEDILTVYKIDANFVYGIFFKKKPTVFKGTFTFRSKRWCSW